MPWPNLACPVAMVECESGREEQSAGAGGAAVAHGSYHNVEEAKLAVRCAADAPLLPALCAMLLCKTCGLWYCRAHTLFRLLLPLPNLLCVARWPLQLVV